MTTGRINQIAIHELERTILEKYISKDLLHFLFKDMISLLSFSLYINKIYPKLLHLPWWSFVHNLFWSKHIISVSINPEGFTPPTFCLAREFENKFFNSCTNTTLPHIWNKKLLQTTARVLAHFPWTFPIQRQCPSIAFVFALRSVCIFQQITERSKYDILDTSSFCRRIWSTNPFLYIDEYP